MLYWIKHDTGKNYMYAYKDLHFPGYRRNICEKCSREIITIEYGQTTRHLILEGGKKFPDLLQFSGAGIMPLIVSESVLNAFERSRVSGYSSYAPVIAESINLTPSVQYYILEVNGRIEMDLLKMQLKRKRYCLSCGQFEWSRQRLGVFHLKPSTWDGSDLCLVSDMTGLKICSDRVVNIVQSHHFSGFLFRPSTDN